MNPLFIVGCPRSGTTALQQSLNRHSKIVIPPETSFLFLPGFPRWEQQSHLARINRDLGIDLLFPSGGVSSAREVRVVFEKMAYSYLKRVRRGNITYFGDKSPEHQLRLESIQEIFPRAKILLIYRDGRDVALSLRGVPWMYSNLYSNFWVWLHYYRIQKESTSWHWPNICYIQYEQLTLEPQREMRRILDFLELDYEPGIAEGNGSRLAFTERELPWKASSLEPLTSSRIGGWRTKLVAQEIENLERWGASAFRDLGYEFATDPNQQLPTFFFPRLFFSLTASLLRRPRYRVFKEMGRQALLQFSKKVKIV